MFPFGMARMPRVRLADASRCVPTIDTRVNQYQRGCETSMARWGGTMHTLIEPLVVKVRFD